MVAPFLASVAAPFVSGAASSLVNSIFGGGSSQINPADFMQTYLNEMNDIALANANRVTASAEDASENAEQKLEDIKSEFSNDVTAKEWKKEFEGNGPGSWSSAVNKIYQYNIDPNDVVDSIITNATRAGVNLTDIVNLPGHGNTTLARATRNLISGYESQAPSLWNETLGKFWVDNMGRTPTKKERKQYSYRNYKNIEDVSASLANNNPEYYARNIKDVDPFQASLNLYVSGSASPFGAWTQGWSPANRHGEPIRKENTPKQSSVSKKGIDTSNPVPRGFDDKQELNGNTSFT